MNRVTAQTDYEKRIDKVVKKLEGLKIFEKEAELAMIRASNLHDDPIFSENKFHIFENQEIDYDYSLLLKPNDRRNALVGDPEFEINMIQPDYIMTPILTTQVPSFQVSDTDFLRLLPQDVLMALDLAMANPALSHEFSFSEPVVNKTSLLKSAKTQMVSNNESRLSGFCISLPTTKGEVLFGFGKSKILAQKRLAQSILRYLANQETLHHILAPMLVQGGKRSLGEKILTKPQIDSLINNMFQFVINESLETMLRKSLESSEFTQKVTERNPNSNFSQNQLSNKSLPEQKSEKHGNDHSALEPLDTQSLAQISQKATSQFITDSCLNTTPRDFAEISSQRVENIHLVAAKLPEVQLLKSKNTEAIKRESYLNERRRYAEFMNKLLEFEHEYGSIPQALSSLRQNLDAQFLTQQGKKFLKFKAENERYKLGQMILIMDPANILEPVKGIVCQLPERGSKIYKVLLNLEIKAPTAIDVNQMDENLNLDFEIDSDLDMVLSGLTNSEDIALPISELKRVNVVKQVSLPDFRKRKRTLEKFAEDYVKSGVSFPNHLLAIVNENFEPTKYRNARLLDALEIVTSVFKLNDQQYEALNKALTFDCSIIHGPPGTGKTLVLACVVCCLVLAYPEKSEKIMLTAPSNAATDRLCQVVCEAIMKIGDRLPENYLTDLFVRLFPDIEEQHLASKLKEYSLTKKAIEIGSPQLKSLHAAFINGTLPNHLMAVYRRNLSKVQIQVLNSHKIFAATLSGSGRPIIEATNSSFLAVICDESAQATQPDSLIPLLATKPLRIILAGDHYQLGPMILSKELCCKDGHVIGEVCVQALEISLFELLKKRLPHTMLTSQYRMCPPIALFPNTLCYHGKLNTILHEGNSPFCKMPNRLPVYALQVNSTEKFLNPGYENRKDAEKVVEAIKYLLAQNVSPDAILVLTFYNGQISLLEHLLQREKLPPQIELSNVEQAQGTEKDHVIICLVRSSYDRVGFLGNKRRLNTALTRAKRSLTLIGNFDALYAANGLYATLNRYYESHGWLDRDSTIPMLQKIPKYFCKVYINKQGFPVRSDKNLSSIERRAKRKEKQKTQKLTIPNTLHSIAADNSASQLPTYPFTASSSILGIITSSLFLFLTLFLFLEPASATNTANEQFHICGATKSGYAIKVPTEIRCIPPELTEVKRVLVELYVPRTTPLVISAHRCHVRTRTVCTRTGLLWEEGIVSDITQVETISSSECWQAKHTLIWKNSRLITQSEGLLSTENKLLVSYKWCCYDVCNSVSNLILEEGQIASLDGETANSDLGDISSCKLSSGVCHTIGGVILWEGNLFQQPICKFEKKPGHFQAAIADKHILIDTLQAAFSYSGLRAPPCVGTNELLMDQGVVIKLSNASRLNVAHGVSANMDLASILGLTVFVKGTNYSDSVTLSQNQPVEMNFDSYNNKFEYLHQKVQRNEAEGFRQVWSSLCLLASRELNMIWQLLRIDATLGARALLNKTDIYASFAGIDILMIWSCKSVIPDFIYYNFTVGDRCYAYIPIRLGSKVWFIIPGSRDLVAEAPIIDCSHHHHAIYFQNGSYYTLGGKTQVAIIPSELIWHSTSHMFAFKAPALFHSQYSGLSTSIGMLRSYVTKIKVLDGQVHRLINYTAELSLNPEVIANALKGWGEGVGQIIDASGHAVGTVLESGGHAFHEVLNGTAGFVNSILSGPVQYIINIAVIIVIVVTILVGFYFLAQYLLARFKRRKPKVTFQKLDKSEASFIESQDISENELRASNGCSNAVKFRQINRSTDSISIENEEKPVSQTKTTLTQRMLGLQHVDRLGNRPLSVISYAEPKVYLRNQNCTSNNIISVCNADQGATPEIQVCLVDCLLNGQAALALLDCGAQVSVISLAAARRMNLNITKPTLKARSTTGHLVNMLGEAAATIELGGLKQRLLFHIIKEDNIELLVGLDVLQNLGPIGFDLQHNQLFISKNPIPLRKAKLSDDSTIVRHLAEFNQQKLVPLAQIYVRIQGMLVTALFDCGSSITILQNKFVKRLGLQLKKPIFKATSMTNHELPLLGVASTTMVIGPKNITLSVHVITQHKYDAIFGLDAMRLLGYFEVDFKTRELQLDNSSISFNQLSHVEWPVILAKTMILPAETEVVVPCSAGHGFRALTFPLLLQPSTTKLTKNFVQIDDGLIAPKEDGDFLLLVRNPTKNSSKLYQGTKIGTLEVLGFSLLTGSINHVASTSSELPTKNYELEPALHKGSWSSKAEFLEKFDLTHLNSDHRCRMQELLWNHAQVFAKNSRDLGRTNLVKHEIDTQGLPPFKQRPYRTPFALREIMNSHIKAMLQDKIIVPSISEYASPAILVPKKDKTWRFVTDYRWLNSQTRKNAHPVPHIQDMLYSLRGKKIFSSLDLMSGFWQIEMDPKDRHKTAFCTHEGLYEFCVMQFGLCNAPSVFQRMMQDCLRGLSAYANCYIDDVLIASESFDLHLEHLSSVFDRLKLANLKVKPTKCCVCLNKLEFLGHTISENGIEVQRSKIDKVLQFERPETLKQLQSFLGLTNYYRKFVKGYQRIAEPLSNLLKQYLQKPPKQSLNWTSQHQESFELLKTALNTAPILAMPDMNKEFIIQTDASATGLGGVLSQIGDDGKEHPIMYTSKTLTQTQRNYSTIERELLAIIHAVKTFRPFVYGRHFKIITDHCPLSWILTAKNLEGRLARWNLLLQEFDCEILYRSGRSNGNADALSRLNTPIKKEFHLILPRVNSLVKSSLKALNFCNFTTEANELTISTDGTSFIKRTGLPLAEVNTIFDNDTEYRRMAEAQRADPDWKPIIDYLTNKTLPDDQVLAKYIKDQSPFYVLHRGRLCYKFFDTRRSLTVLKLVAPASLREEIIRLNHDAPFSGHQGFHRTLRRIKQNFYWPKMRREVYHYVATCTICQTVKDPIPRAKSPLKLITPPKDKFELIEIDFSGPYHPKSNGYAYILVIIDYKTKFLELFPTVDEKAETAAKILVEEIVLRYGGFKTLLSDRGRHFTAGVVKEVCRTLGIDKQYSTAYRPQTQGAVERTNRTIATTLAMYIATNKADWSSYLSYIRFALNTSIHSSTSESPYFLTFGRDPILPFCLGIQAPNPITCDPDDYAKLVAMRIHQAMNITAEALQRAQSKYKHQFDKSASEPKIHIGMRVWLRNESTPPGISRKFCPKWNGPYRVLNLKGKTCEIRLESNPISKPEFVHIDRLKPCKDRLPVLYPNTVQVADDNFETQAILKADANEAPPEPSSSAPAISHQLKRTGLRPRDKLKAPVRLQ